MTDEAPTPPRRHGWAVAVGVLAVAAIAVALMITLLMENTSEGASAITEAKGSTRVALARVTERVAADGGSLRVTWSEVPSPTGGSHQVTARLEIEPSGEVEQALFVVAGERVIAQNATARRLLAVPSD